ncbi:hypothetical protein EDEG_00976 [Edhazardia aedis USNM 41457]|uniref:Uncharacterized protein n=1 Tax=Edhazardia aedis (strain USNM 41457) TaxID=1003232 RepID=J9DBG6_EDHAE|nr:hypothetical protein EDEG_00976 [Edhazardia aedis USNM 41457]|eukprot:EJW04839.1 hypothetical protein EDEG_00976 [Edhazardia aedis USNM 41457]
MKVFGTLNFFSKQVFKTFSAIIMLLLLLLAFLSPLSDSLNIRRQNKNEVRMKYGQPLNIAHEITKRSYPNIEENGYYVNQTAVSNNYIIDSLYSSLGSQENGFFFEDNFNNNNDFSLTQEKALKHIREHNNSILFQFTVSDIFGTLLFNSFTEVKDEGDEFRWKYKLHKQLLDFPHVRRLMSESITEQISGLEKEGIFISKMCDHIARFEEISNTNFDYSRNNLGAESFCDDEETKIPKNFITTTTTYEKENMRFISKFNHIFDLYWKRVFLITKNNEKTLTEFGVDFFDFYNLNKNVFTLYNVRELRFYPLIIKQLD